MATRARSGPRWAWRAAAVRGGFPPRCALVLPEAAVQLCVRGLQCGLPLLAPHAGAVDAGTAVPGRRLLFLLLRAMGRPWCAVWWWWKLGVDSQSSVQNSAAAGESMARPWSADDGDVRGRHHLPEGVVEGGLMFFSHAPGEALPDPAVAALCVVLPLEGTALEQDSAGGPVTLVVVVSLLALLSV